MIINGKNLNIDKALDFANSDELILKHRKNGFLLSDYQVSVLSMNGFNYQKYGNIHELLFDIEDALNDEYDEQLDCVSKQISELIYYSETKK